MYRLDGGPEGGSGTPEELQTGREKRKVLDMTGRRKFTGALMWTAFSIYSCLLESRLKQLNASCTLQKDSFQLLVFLA